MNELTHNAFGWIVGAFVIGMILGAEFSAHWATDINRRDDLANFDHDSEAIDLVKRTVIP